MCVCLCVCVCSSHIKAFFLPVGIQHIVTTSVRADSSILEETQVLWSQSYYVATYPGTRYLVPWYAVSTTVGNACMFLYV